MKILVKNAFSQIALIFLLIVLTSFTFKRGNSVLSINFKGKKFVISNADDKLKNVYGHTLAKSIVSNNETLNVSFIGIHAFSNSLNIDFGGVKQGGQIGDYNFQILESASKSFYFGIYMPSRPNAQETYFATQHFSPKTQNGVFFDLAKGGKRWEIIAENSTITVTKSDAEKLEGTFDLDLSFANAKEKATGTFVIYR